MIHKIFLISAALLLTSNTLAEFKKPLILGHRGASGYRPEHTLAAYQLAIDMGADYIEPDLVMTKDKVLMARHENEISGTTNVAEIFPDRKTTKEVDGVKVTGWFIEDFTLKEIKKLRAKERLDFRDHSFDGKFEVPTFSEILKLVKKQSKKIKRTIGVYPETKHPSYFNNIGLPLEVALIEELNKQGLNAKNSPVFIQSFELGSLKKIKSLSSLPLIFLIDDPDKIPFDFVLEGKKTTYLELLKPESLKELSSTISGIGPHKRYIIPVNDKDEKLPPTELIKLVHSLGLLIHPYTFRSENRYLHKDYKGDAQNEYLEFYRLGVDGVFTDFSDQAIKARELFLKEERK